MKRSIILILLGCLVLALAVTSLPTKTVQALPEYASQTGEPCASCHVSPSGGGVRTLRGQAWVGGGKPSTVPGELEALELLGVHIDVDEATFHDAPETLPPAEPPTFNGADARQIYDWVSGYGGN